MDEALEAFLDSLPEQCKRKLDGSAASLVGIPLLNGGRIEAVPICPLTNITALLSRRTGEFLKNTYARLAEQRSTAS